MDLGRPDYAGIAAWPTHRAHVVRLVETGELIEVKAPNDCQVDAAIQAGTIVPVIPDGEPCFLLRGQDVATPPTLRFYAGEAERQGADPGLVAQVYERADLIDAWQEANRRVVPDLPGRVPERPQRSSYPTGASDDRDLDDQHRTALIHLGMLRAALDGMALNVPGRTVKASALFEQMFGAVESVIRHHALMAEAETEVMLAGHLVDPPVEADDERRPDRTDAEGFGPEYPPV